LRLLQIQLHAVQKRSLKSNVDGSGSGSGLIHAKGLSRLREAMMLKEPCIELLLLMLLVDLGGSWWGLGWNACHGRQKG
jgi:hypothetical protein